MEKLNIRQLDERDVPALCTFAERTFRLAWQHMNEPEPFEAYCREHFQTERLLDEMRQPGSVFYFAESAGDVAAYLKVNLHCSREELQGEPALQLERIYVDPAVQSRGLGAGLVGFCEALGRQNGAKWLWLSVWTKSPRSIAFYEKIGFEIFGVETFWVGNDPQPDWLMKKRLSL